MFGSIKKAARNMVGNVLSHLGSNKITGGDLIPPVISGGDKTDFVKDQFNAMYGRRVDTIIHDDLPTLPAAPNRADRSAARKSMRSRNTSAVKFHVKRSGNFNTTRIVHQSLSDKGFQFACNSLLQALLNKLPVYEYSMQGDDFGSFSNRVRQVQ